MPSTIEQLSPTRVKITVEVPFADLQPSMDKAYAEVAKSVNIPGFRRGKVPPVVIDQRFGRGVIIQEAFNDSWQGFYGAALTENNLSPLAQPDVEVTKLEDGALIEFTAEVDVRPEFELRDFTTLQAQVDALDVPDTLVESQIDGLRNRFGSRETVERAAASGAKILMPPSDQVWGDRTAWIMDPSGHVWTIATRIGESTEEERRARLADIHAAENR